VRVAGVLEIAKLMHASAPPRLREGTQRVRAANSLAAWPKGGVLLRRSALQAAPGMRVIPTHAREMELPAAVASTGRQ
jgi:hypothetical protein